MARRKPPELSSVDWMEQLIRNAQVKGEFDNLEGHGKPIADLGTTRAPGWFSQRMVADEQLTDALPPGMRLARDVSEFKKSMAAIETEERLRVAIREINARIAKTNATQVSGPPSRTAVMDEEAVVSRWREDCTD